MSLPLTMTLTGSVPLLIFILLWALQREHFSPFLGVRFLKISLFFYLVPVQLLYHILPNSFYYFFKPEESDLLGKHSFPLTYNNELIIPIDGEFLWIPRLIVLLLAVWLVCILIFSLAQVKIYRRIQKMLHIYTPQKYTCVSQKEVSILKLPYVCSPYSIGFFKSCIVFSGTLWESDYQRELYRHELCHIKNKDIWMKLLCLGAICIHFYNPLVYLLFFLYHICSECICDSYAIEGLSIEKRKQYARLLVELAETKNPVHSVLQNCFSKSKFCIKERIHFIMKKPNIKQEKRISTLLLTVLSILLCTTTIWAYQPPKITNWNPQTLIGEKEYVELISPEFSYKSDFYSEEDVVDFSLSNTVIQTENDFFFPVPVTDDLPKVTCIHNFQTRYLLEHASNNNGGCSVKKYKVSICTKCTYIKSKTYQNTVSYAKCPHNK